MKFFMMLLLAACLLSSFSFAAMTITYGADQTATIKNGGTTLGSVQLLNNISTGEICSDSFFSCNVDLRLMPLMDYTFNSATKIKGNTIGGSSTYYDNAQIYSGGQWIPLITDGVSIVSGNSYIVRLVYKRSNLNDMADLVPSLYGLQFTEWAWWNPSTAYRMNVSNAGVSTSFPLAINNTGKFGSSVIWTSSFKSNNLAVYYNTSSLYAVVINDSTIANYETEGGGLNNSISSVYPAAINSDYHFGEATGLVRDSKGTANCNLSAAGAGASYAASGLFGGSYYFDGAATSYLNSSSACFPAILNGASRGFTISYWAKFNGLTTQQIMWSASAAGGGSPADWFMDFYSNSMRMYGTTGGSYAWVPDTNWHMWTGVYNGTNSLIYKDGVLVKTAFDTGTNGATAYYLNLAGRAAGQNFKGTMDEFILFNSVLTANEINELYNNSQTSGAGSMTLGSQEIPPPTFSVILVLPSDNSFIFESGSSFSANVSGTASSYNCTLYINGTASGSGNFINSTIGSITMNNTFPSAIVNWNMTCSNSSIDNSSSNRTAIVYAPAPTAAQVWAYASRTLTNYNESYAAYLVWLNANRSTSNLTATDVWSATTRTLTNYNESYIAYLVWQSANKTNNMSSAEIAYQVWQNANRSTSNLTTSDIPSAIANAYAVWQSANRSTSNLTTGDIPTALAIAYSVWQNANRSTSNLTALDAAYQVWQNANRSTSNLTAADIPTIVQIAYAVWQSDNRSTSNLTSADVALLFPAEYLTALEQAQLYNASLASVILVNGSINISSTFNQTSLMTDINSSINATYSTASAQVVSTSSDLVYKVVFALIAISLAAIAMIYNRTMLWLISGAMWLGLGLLLYPSSLIMMVCCTGICLYLWIRSVVS